MQEKRLNGIFHQNIQFWPDFTAIVSTFQFTANQKYPYLMTAQAFVDCSSGIVRPQCPQQSPVILFIAHKAGNAAGRERGHLLLSIPD